MCGRISGRWKRLCKSHETLRNREAINSIKRSTIFRRTKVESELSQSYNAKYMREWRKTHPFTPEQRRKDNARSYAGVYLRRGKIQKLPCASCGSLESQMHHPDYSRPLLIEWLCRSCHFKLHRLNHPKSPFPAMAVGPCPPLASVPP